MRRPEIVVQTAVEREVVIPRKDRKFTIRAPLQFGLIPHSLKLYFTVKVTNKGNESAFNVVSDNHIPANTVYAVGSAHVEQGTVLCSCDGDHFHDEKEQLQQSDSCTSLRWLIDELTPGSTSFMEFQVVVANVEDL